MFLTPLGYGVAAVLVWQFQVAAYQFAQAVTGRACGIQVEEVSIGFGPSLLRRTIRGWQIRIAALPLGGFTRFKRDKDRGNDPASERLPGGRWEDASSLGQIVTALSGPLASLLIGLVLLGLPVWAGADQLVVTPSDESQVWPCAVGGLGLRNEPSNCRSQW